MDINNNDVAALMGLDASSCTDVESYVNNFNTDEFTYHRKGRFYCSPTFPLVEKLGVYGKLCFNGSRSWMHVVFSTTSTRQFQLVSRIWRSDELIADWKCPAEDAYIFSQQFNSKKRSLYPDEHLFHTGQYIRIQILCRPVGPPLTVDELLIVDYLTVLAPEEKEGAGPWSELYSRSMSTDEFCTGAGGSHFSAHDCVDAATSLFLSVVFKDSDSWLKGTFGNTDVIQTVETRVMFLIRGEIKAFNAKFGPNQRVLQLPPNFFEMGMHFTMKCRVRALPNHPVTPLHDQPWRFPTPKSKKLARSGPMFVPLMPPPGLERSGPGPLWRPQSAPHNHGKSLDRSAPSIMWRTSCEEFVPRSRNPFIPLNAATRVETPLSSSKPMSLSSELDELATRMANMQVDPARTQRSSNSMSSNTSSGVETFASFPPNDGSDDWFYNSLTENSSSDESTYYRPNPIGYERDLKLKRSTASQFNYNQFVDIMHSCFGLTGVPGPSVPHQSEPSTPKAEPEPLPPTNYIPAATPAPTKHVDISVEYTNYIWTGKLECEPQKLEALRYFAQQMDNSKLVDVCADKIWERDNLGFYDF